ncbi:type IX secretion system membrane protein PorP/SprF [Gangjinia marincola]
MKKNISILVIFLIAGLSTKMSAQQDPQYTQYMYNQISFNPAYTGSKEALSGLLLYRSQWLGLDGAPDTFTFSVHSPVDMRKKIGLGLNIIRDEIGPVDETTIDATFSYAINTGAMSKLAFGLKAGGHLLNVNFQELNEQNPGQDVLLQDNIDNNFSPNVGLGLFHYGERHYVGLSVPNLLETEHFDDVNNAVAEERMTYYLTGGYVFDLGINTKFKPTVLAKAIDGAPLQLDGSANFMFYDKFTLGAAYRWDAAVSALVGFRFADQWTVGFAYDYDTTDFEATNDGSIEIFLQFDLFRAYDMLVSPRFF